VINSSAEGLLGCKKDAAVKEHPIYSNGYAVSSDGQPFILSMVMLLLRVLKRWRRKRGRSKICRRPIAALL